MAHVRTPRYWQEDVHVEKKEKVPELLRALDTALLTPFQVSSNETEPSGRV